MIGPPQVSQERLLQCLERALVNVVNAVGVDINQAVKEPYLQKLLPFVAGLGPRKAEALIRNITRSVSAIYIVKVRDPKADVRVVPLMTGRKLGKPKETD